MSFRSIPYFGRNLIRQFSILRSNQSVDVKHEFHDIIKWNKPSRLTIWDPQKSCDTKSLKKIEPNTLRLEYRPFTQAIERQVAGLLKTSFIGAEYNTMVVIFSFYSLPEDERKLFTVGLGRRKDTLNVIMEDTTSLVKRHKYDKESPEYKGELNSSTLTRIFA